MEMERIICRFSVCEQLYMLSQCVRKSFGVAPNFSAVDCFRVLLNFIQSAFG